MPEMMHFWKTATRSPNFFREKMTSAFFMKSMSNNNFKLKNQFQEAYPTGAQNLTLAPTVISDLGKAQIYKISVRVIMEVRPENGRMFFTLEVLCEHAK